MMKVTQKSIKAYLNIAGTVDVTHMKTEDIYELQKAHNFRTLAYSAGLYGCNGLLKVDENGIFYVVIGHCTAMYAFS